MATVSPAQLEYHLLGNSVSVKPNKTLTFGLDIGGSDDNNIDDDGLKVLLIVLGEVILISLIPVTGISEV